MGKAQKIATENEIAAVDFKARQHDADQWTPPTNEEWSKIGENKLPPLRIAWHILYKSKSELMDIIDSMNDETYFAMCNGVRDVEKFFKAVTPSRALPRRGCLPRRAQVFSVRGGKRARERLKHFEGQYDGRRFKPAAVSVWRPGAPRMRHHQEPRVFANATIVFAKHRDRPI
jgi:hypothetical protein